MALELANGRWDFLQEVATKHEGQNLRDSIWNRQCKAGHVPEFRWEQTPWEPWRGCPRVKSPRAEMGMMITGCSESAAPVVLLTERGCC